ncbi:16S rRNA (uracil(1498)-N(3))-methyltransferase [Prevotella sp. A2931]|uniref:Ribosomal RNA small subunit methyltransferase E n=1 Tax=Prevotella illustrans TaxID=2800387 RepID=A0ABS3M2L4_9BACT|nr:MULTISPECIES: 16S rRNA (uracil(1498)-N(3))-methyltransferase [Prevotella]MBO1362430.1 16S rRNA (uracil(1498)-N(3))-methyltransferase [Prevotella illustrans]PTL25056.1 16S rRNA (uracil(1498)-N(3))-methyltransferase [Prevotella sp. oral taxon 820]
MREVRFFYVPDASTVTELPVEEAAHAVKVLRLHQDDEIFLIDGKGIFYKAVVDMANHKHCLYHVVETLPQKKSWRGRIQLAIAPTKHIDRIEWMAEKATEIGFDGLYFLRCDYSERTVIRRDRVEKVVVAAVKQSRKPYMPEIGELMAFGDFIHLPLQGHRFIAHCYDEISKTELYKELDALSPDDDVTVLVGPEGDFSVNEVREAIACGFKPISLGQSRLRTETAGLAAVMMCNLKKQFV